MLVQGSARKRTLGAPSPSRAPLLLRAVPHGDSDTTTDSPPPSKARPPLPSILPAQSQSARPLRSQCRGTFCCRPSWGSGVVAPPATSLRLRTALAPRASAETGQRGFICPGPSPFSSSHCSPLSACAPVSRTTRVPQSHNGCHLWAKPGRTVHLLLQRPFRLSSGKPVLILAESALPGGPLR